jgi:hypothetical protein
MMEGHPIVLYSPTSRTFFLRLNTCFRLGEAGFRSVGGGFALKDVGQNDLVFFLSFFSLGLFTLYEYFEATSMGRLREVITLGRQGLRFFFMDYILACGEMYEVFKELSQSLSRPQAPHFLLSS